MTPKILLEIAREHARRGAKMRRDKKGLYRYRIGPHADLLGILIPQSLYWSTRGIESFSTYELCDGSIFTKESLETIIKIDHIQAFNDQKQWGKKLDQLLREVVRAPQQNTKVY